MVTLNSPLAFKENNMTIQERLEYFGKNYELIATYHLGKGKKEYIGNDNKICRFCRKTELNVTFKTIAHAVPEFLGNKQLILQNECDNCNTFVSNNLENHLDKYTKPYRLTAQIKGKKKVPNYKSKDKKSRYEFHRDEGSKIISPENSGFASIDTDNNEIKTNFHLEPHIPSAVYKCLVKIALSVISDNELEEFKSTLDWLMNNNHSQTICKPLILLTAFIPGHKPNEKLTIIVLRRKLDSIVIPYCLFIICFGNIAYQIVVPSDKDIAEGKQTMKLIRFPLPFEQGWEYGEIIYGQEDLTNPEEVKDKNLPMSFSFDKAVKLDPDSIQL